MRLFVRVKVQDVGCQFFVLLLVGQIKHNIDEVESGQ